MHELLVDTDVILDLFIDREPHHTTALRFFSYLDLNRDSATAYTSHVAVANVVYILGKLQTEEYAIEKIKGLRALVHIAAMTEAVVDNALGDPYKDFEDSIQYYCAVENDIRSIVTRNTKDFPKRDVRIVTPEEFMAMDLTERSI